MLGSWFIELGPVTQALLATLFTWGVTALGSALIFIFPTENRKALDVMLGFTAGVMIAASFWSLLAPGIEMAEGGPVPAVIPALVGFLGGAAFLRFADRFLPHVHPQAPDSEAEGVETTWERSTLMIFAITLHNIPEGLAVGVAFGAAAVSGDAGLLATATTLALGIGIQNFPEGAAVSFPLRKAGLSPGKAFMWGQFSGMVEPVAGVLGAAAVVLWQPVLPYALSFAAGAMIFVVVEEVIPESQRGGNGDAATMGAMLGFAVMMTLDVALG